MTNGGNKVNVMLGDGNGGFTLSTGSPFTVGNGATSVVAGDFNGDGNVDFAVTNKTDNTISVMLGDGTGNAFSNATGSPISTGTATAPVSIAAADFNGSGTLDLAVANSGQNQILIFKGSNTGAFTAMSTYATGTTPLSIVAGNFNGDGSVDLAVTNSGQTTVSLFRGNGDVNLTFQAQTTAPVGTTPSAITAGDFNGDGTTDLAVGRQRQQVCEHFVERRVGYGKRFADGRFHSGQWQRHRREPPRAGRNLCERWDIQLFHIEYGVARFDEGHNDRRLLSASTTTPSLYGQQVS